MLLVVSEFYARKLHVFNYVGTEQVLPLIYSGSYSTYKQRDGLMYVL